MSATKSTLVQFSFSIKDVPLFLRETEFFRSLEDDGEDITLPQKVCKFDSTISSVDDLLNLLSTMRFWGVTSFSANLAKFVIVNHSKVMAVLLSDFSKELKQVQWLEDLCRKLPIYSATLAKDTFFSVNVARGSGFTDGVVGLICEQYKRSGIVWSADTCALAAELAWCNGLIFLHDCDFPWDEKTCAAAAMSGSLECLTFAYERGCPWDEKTVINALIQGHRDCLEYAVKHGCPCPPQWQMLASSGPLSGPWDATTCAKFAAAGNVTALKFAHKHGCPWDNRVLIFACIHGHLPCFVYALENGCPGKEDACLLIGGWFPHWACAEHLGLSTWYEQFATKQESPLHFMVSKIHLRHECPTDTQVARLGITLNRNRPLWLDLALRHGCPRDERMFQVAVLGDHADLLLYALDHGCLRREEVVVVAAQRWSMLQLVVFRGCKLLSEAYVSAAASDAPLRAVKLLHARGCPLDARAVTAFAKFKRLGCLQFALANGAPWDQTAPAAAARLLHNFVKCSHAVQEQQALNCLHFLHANGCPWDVSTCKEAAHSGNLSCLQYADQQGCPWDDSVSMAAFIPSAWYDKQLCLEYVTRRTYLPTESVPTQAHKLAFNPEPKAEGKPVLVLDPSEELQHESVEATKSELKQQESKPESVPFVALAKAALVFFVIYAVQ